MSEKKLNKTGRTTLKFKKLHLEAKLPVKGTPLSAGYDLFALKGGSIQSGARGLVSTGLSVQMPDCQEDGMVWCLKIEPRSSLSLKKGIETGAGVIDADYRGDIGVVLFNHSNENFTYNKGDKIAQFLVFKVANFECCEVEDLTETQRGQGGFGSTGK